MSRALNRTRAVIATVATTGIVIAGTMLGASLKDTQRDAERQEEVRKATPEQIIASINSRIKDLQGARNDILRKLDALDQDAASQAQNRNQNKAP